MVAPALIGALVGAGYGALAYGKDKERADTLREQNATFERTSPWTGIHGKPVAAPSQEGHIMQGALSGASFGMQDAFNGKDKKAAAGGEDSLSLTEEPMAGGSRTAPPEGNYVSYPGPPPPTQGDYSNPNASGYSPWAGVDTSRPSPAVRPPENSPMFVEPVKRKPLPGESAYYLGGKK